MLQGVESGQILDATTLRVKPKLTNPADGKEFLIGDLSSLIPSVRGEGISNFAKFIGD